MPVPRRASAQPPGAGLCDTCRHQRVVRNTRGSVFSMCLRSREELTYPRYPRLPVLECAGYERSRPGSSPSTQG